MPSTHIVGPWVINSTNLYRDLRTGTQYIGNWASRVGEDLHQLRLKRFSREGAVPQVCPYLAGFQGWIPIIIFGYIGFIWE